ncbi:MAG TPA: tRNA (adenosine(37)-N6)-threonylcarbamoyltransferase complex dimerization subunit type 1 TsaB [Candidatus Limnocylindria bacterium]|nr:tRNA (adenosine(37)-N6)-threonylcarbamoyltransferase complex dimerization subunit type 1 TsaB [Candidatus Limnocylindria bacterium]
MYFLAIQNTYEAIEVALCDTTRQLDAAQISKIDASKLLINTLDQLLQRNNRSLSDISFIAVNQGPGPFTTLRVVIATVNGISFARGIPLVGINGLQALLQEHAHTNYPFALGLLNAFNNDVYFGVSSHGTMIQDGYDNIHTLMTHLVQQFPTQSFYCSGNAIALHRTEIIAALGSRAIIPEHIPATCSLEQIHSLGLEQWHQRIGIATQLMPLYLKPFTSFIPEHHGNVKTPRS